MTAKSKCLIASCATRCRSGWHCCKLASERSEKVGISTVPDDAALEQELDDVMSLHALLTQSHEGHRDQRQVEQQEPEQHRLSPQRFDRRETDLGEPTRLFFRIRHLRSCFGGSRLSG